MLRAMEQIKRMRGGAQSHLMRCSDGHSHELYYVVKFQNNPQHRRILVNELLGTRLAARLGLPTTPVEIIDVPEELIRLTPDLTIELPRSRVPCKAGLQFGSLYPVQPWASTVHDFLTDEHLRHVQNLHDFAGMLVFDKWLCNTNGRQAVFFREAQEGSERFARPGAARAPSDAELSDIPYKARMIDQGFCFNAGEWNFPDAPLRGLYARNRVYEGVTGMESFGPWVARAEGLSERTLAQLYGEVPPEWYEDDADAIYRLLEQLFRRRARLPDLLLAAKNSSRQPFPNWR